MGFARRLGWGLARAELRTAFALVGSATHVTPETLGRYRRFVVDAFGTPSETFVLLKAIDAAGAPMSAARVAEVRRSVAEALAPVASDVNSSDVAFAKFQSVRAAIAARLWPALAGMYSGHARRKTEDRIAYWWGALDLAWAMIAARERAAGARFDYVVTTRADLAFEAPIRDASRVDPRYWYSAPDPPDAFWISSRDVAARAMTTASAAARCLGGAGADDCERDAVCDLADRFVFKMFSWYVPCLWARLLFNTGLRLVLDGDLRATWRHADGEARSVTQCAPKIACTHLARDACNATVHTVPWEMDFACGPWYSERCDRRRRLGQVKRNLRSDSACNAMQRCRGGAPGCPVRREPAGCPRPALPPE